MSHPALAVLERQRAAWNRGDLAGYVALCAEDVVYLTTRGPNLGRDALAATMAAAYPDRAAMGALHLEVLRLDALGDPETDGASAAVSLRWTVARPEATIGGLALVVLRRESGEWWMTHDATMRGDPGPLAP